MIPMSISQVTPTQENKHKNVTEMEVLSTEKCLNQTWTDIMEW